MKIETPHGHLAVEAEIRRVGPVDGYDAFEPTGRFFLRINGRSVTKQDFEAEAERCGVKAWHPEWWMWVHHLGITGLGAGSVVVEA